MLTLSDFRSQYGEFKATADAIVQSALDRAALRTDADVFGTLTDSAHGLLAAHLLTQSPMGREARLTKDSEKTIYEIERGKLEALVGSGYGLL